MIELKSDNLGQRKYNIALFGMAFVNVLCFGDKIGEKTYLSLMLFILGMYKVANEVGKYINKLKGE